MKRIIAYALCFTLLISAAVTPAFAFFDSTAGDICARITLEDVLYMIFHKEALQNEKFTGAVSEDTWSAADEYSVDDTAVVIKEKDKDFVILNITDNHFTDYGERVWMGWLASATIKRLVCRVKPDLITVTGDVVCGESCVYAIKQFTQLMDSFGIPWAPVFGNHENDGNCDLNFLADIMLTSENCLLKKGPADLGVGNYIVNIAEKDGDRLNVVQSLIMADTHEKHLNQQQIEWYKWAATGISTAMGHDVESSVFFHIPCAQYQYAYDAAWNSESESWRDGFDASGALNEKICCERDADGEPVDNGFFDAVKSVGTTKNIFCGHEHMNNFSIVYEGVRLTYTLKVGLGSGFQAGFNGGTVITVNNDGVSFKHMYSL